MPIPPLLIVQTGSVAPELRAVHGDYPDWFIRALGAKASRMPIVRAHEGERLLLPKGVKGVIVTGSPHSALEGAPWMEELGEKLFRVANAGTPVLGVCFGHQLLAKAAGGGVVKNPHGREIGTVVVQLTPAGRKDPLFRGWAPDSGAIDVPATHEDAVHPLPPSATILASNENCPVQAARFSDAVASVQFHPELRPETLRDLIASRAAKIRAEGFDPDQLRAAVRETQAAKLLHAFAEEARRS